MYRASLIAQTVKRLPTTRETQAQSLGQEDPLEKEMAPHSSTLARKIPWTKEPGRLGSQWQPTPVFLPGESQGWGSLVGCRLWGHTESDMTEVT